MNFFGLQYRKRQQVRDGEDVDAFVNWKIGWPSLSLRFFDRVTFNSSRLLHPVVRIAKGWTWRP